MNELCRHLEWDTAFFGYNIGRVNVNRLTLESLAQIDAWCDDVQIDCLYFLADSGDYETAWIANQNGFNYVDTRITWTLTMTHAPLLSTSEQAIRLGIPSDLPALKGIARTNHRDSRFYFDPVFPVERSNVLFETWIEKSLAGSLADTVLVITENDHPIGYSAVQFTPLGGQINLIGVSPELRGQGVGTQLLRASLFHFWDRGLPHIDVVTQGRNLGAQRLYAKQGFIPSATSNWYHRWSSKILANYSKLLSR